MGWKAQTPSPSLHTDSRELAQPDRNLLWHSLASDHSPRRLSVQTGTHRPNPRLPRHLQPRSTPIRVDLLWQATCCRHQLVNAFHERDTSVCRLILDYLALLATMCRAYYREP